MKAFLIKSYKFELAFFVSSRKLKMGEALLKLWFSFP
jgi:hypothetical protein